MRRDTTTRPIGGVVGALRESVRGGIGGVGVRVRVLVESGSGHWWSLGESRGIGRVEVRVGALAELG